MKRETMRSIGSTDCGLFSTSSSPSFGELDSLATTSVYFISVKSSSLIFLISLFLKSINVSELLSVNA